MHSQSPGLSRPPRAVRLTFAYEGDQVSLVDQRAVDVIVPPSDARPPAQGAGGLWMEVRGDQEEVLHLRVIPDPWRQDVEIFSPEPSQTIRRVPVDRPSGTFSVLLPAPEEADHVVVLGTPTPGIPTIRAVKEEGPVELARFPIRP